MKNFILTIALSICSAASASAMGYELAREHARYLTDKMAYELNFNEQQYNDCYEINLDYLMNVNTAGDVYGDYLSYRNADLRHILLDWQYSLFAAADYFIRPLTFYRGAWVFPVYSHYRAGHFYYAHPVVFNSYRGGHGRLHHRAGFYASRRPHWDGGFRGNPHHYGHPSSTRITVNATPHHNHRPHVGGFSAPQGGSVHGNYHGSVHENGRGGDHGRHHGSVHENNSGSVHGNHQGGVQGNQHRDSSMGSRGHSRSVSRGGRRI